MSENLNVSYIFPCFFRSAFELSMIITQQMKMRCPSRMATLLSMCSRSMRGGCTELLSAQGTRACFLPIMLKPSEHLRICFISFSQKNHESFQCNPLPAMGRMGSNSLYSILSRKPLCCPLVAEEKITSGFIL